MEHSVTITRNGAFLMQSYSDFYKDIITIIKDSVDRAVENIQGHLFCEVITSDGYYAVVKPVSADKNIIPIQNVPVMQSPYYAPITMPGDFGLCLNVGLDLGQFLKGGNKRGRISGKSYYVFFPLLKKDDYNATNLKAVISSADLASKIELTNESIAIEHTGNFEANIGGDSSLISQGNHTFEAQGDTTIKSTGNVNMEGAEIAMSGQSAVNVEGAQIAISANAPIEIAGAGGTLGDAFQSIFDCLNGVASGMTGPSTNPGALMAQLPAAIAKVKTIVK